MFHILKTFIFKGLLLASLIFLQSCGNSGSDSISENSEDKSTQIKPVNYFFNVLEHQNVINLFIVNKWDKKYPEMFSTIKKISKDSWNHLFLPIDQAYFSNEKKREEFFRKFSSNYNNPKLVQEKKKLFDDVSAIGSIFYSANLHQTISKIFDQAKQNKGISEKDLVNALSFLEMDQKTLSSIQDLVKLWMKFTLENQKILKEELGPFLKEKEFNEVRDEVLFNILKNLEKDFLNKDDLDFWTSFFFMSRKEDRTPWLKEMVGSSFFNLNSFKNFLGISSRLNGQYLNQLELFRKSFELDYFCKIDSGHIELDHKEDYLAIVDVMKNHSKEKFFETLLQYRIKIEGASETCNWGTLNVYKKKLNLVDFSKETNQILSDDLNYNLSQFMLMIPSELGFEDNFYLIDFITKDNFKEIGKFNLQIKRMSDRLLELFIKFIKKQDSNTYWNIGHLTKHVLENKEEFQSFLKVIISIREMGVKFNTVHKEIYELVDIHFKGELSLQPLFSFYDYFLLDLDKKYPSFKKSYLEKNKQTTLKALKEMSGHYKSEKSYQDLKKFFSRDGIITSIEAISKVVTLKKEEFSPEKKKTNGPNFIETNPLFVLKNPYKNTEKDVSDYLDCINNLEELNFYQYFQNIPKSCEKFKDVDASFLLFELIKIANDNYSKFKKDKNAKLFSKETLISKEFLGSFFGTGMILKDLLYDRNSTGIRYVMDTIREHLYVLKRKNQKKGYLDEAELVIKDAKNLFFPKSDNDEFFNLLLNEVASFTDQEIKEFFKNLSIIINDYSKFSDSRNNFKRKKRCLDLAKNVGPKTACPSEAEIKKVMYKSLVRFNTRFNRKTMLELAIEGLHPKYGAVINDKSRGRKKQIRIKDIITFLYLAGTNDTKRSMLYKHGFRDRGTKLYLNAIERSEIVIRDIGFRNNFIGSYWQNHVYNDLNYQEKVAKMKGQFNLCSQKFVRFCGRSLTKDEQAMARNAVEAYDSLIQLAGDFNVKGIGRINNSDVLNTVFSIMHHSSSESAKFTKNLKFLDDSTLKRHNGYFLVDIANVSLFRNLSRIIHNRFSSHDKFLKYYHDEQLDRIDDKLLGALEKDQLIFHIKNIINGKKGTKCRLECRYKKLTELFYSLVGNINGSDKVYNHLESLMANTAILLTYLGDENRFGKKGSWYDLEFSKNSYQDNKIEDVFEAASTIIDVLLENKSFLQNVDISYVIGPVDRLVHFFNTKLSKSNPNRKVYYNFLNKAFRLFKKNLLSEDKKDSLIKIVHNLLKNKNDLNKVVSTIYSYLSRLHLDKNTLVENKSMLRDFSKFLWTMGEAKLLSFKFVKNYILFTLKKTVEVNGQKKNNVYYNQVSEIVDFLGTRQNNQTYFKRSIDVVFKDHYEEIIEFFESIMNQKNVVYEEPLNINTN